MEFISIFNDVLGPVMRGPSSSHTAGSYRIGRIARSLLGEEPARAAFTFDPQGSYAKTYREQGADLGFAAGLLEWDITDDRFHKAREFAVQAGIEVEFNVAPLKKADHPNTVEIQLAGQSGKRLRVLAQSVGGTARQATDAAAISLQNAMGSVCDLVQGICEIPCHTRNAVAAASAFVSADLILGGYVNFIPLDETIDAVFSVGKMLPREMRCTSLGGIAVAPSAQALPRLK